MNNTLDFFKNLDRQSRSYFIYTEDNQVPLSYKSNISGGKFEERNFTTSNKNKQKVKYNMTEGLELLVEPSILEQLNLGILETLENYSEYEDNTVNLSFVKETGLILNRSFYTNTAEKLSLNNIVELIEFQTYVEQVFQYNVNMKKSYGIGRNLSELFDNLLFIPNKLSDMELDSETSNKYTLKYLEDEIFNGTLLKTKDNLNGPQPLYFIENGLFLTSNTEIEDTSHYTRVYSIVDIIDYFCNSCTPRDKKIFHTKKREMCFLICSHYKKSLATLRGTGIYSGVIDNAKAKENVKINYYFLPRNDNLNYEQHYSNINALYSKKFSAITFKQNIEFLDMLHPVLGLASLNIDELKELYRGWDIAY